MTAYMIVSTHGVSVGVGMVGAHPQCEWLLGWLRDHVTRDQRLQRGAGEAAGTLAALVREQWPDRPFFVEVPRKDQLGKIRVEGTGEPLGMRPN